MRRVSYIEMYVVVPRILGSSLIGLMGGSRYVNVTFAADFDVFKSMLTTLFDAVGVTGRETSGHLRVVAIFVPQPSVVMGITCEASEDFRV